MDKRYYHEEFNIPEHDPKGYTFSELSGQSLYSASEISERKWELLVCFGAMGCGAIIGKVIIFMTVYFGMFGSNQSPQYSKKSYYSLVEKTKKTLFQGDLTKQKLSAIALDFAKETNENIFLYQDDSIMLRMQPSYDQYRTKSVEELQNEILGTIHKIKKETKDIGSEAQFLLLAKLAALATNDN